MTAITPAMQDLIMIDQSMINQSKIKRLRPDIVCPHKYFREEVSGVDRRPTTEAMRKGQYFEYKLYRTMPKEGGIPVIPPLKNGKQSTDHLRIDVQIENYPKIMAGYGIKSIKSDLKVTIPFEGITFHGTNDVLVEWKNKPYILDLKLTANVDSTFGDFAWGNIIEMHPDGNGMYIARFNEEAFNKFEDMDLIQAHSYMYQMEILTKRQWGFLYAVFDYKPKSSHKIIEVPFDPVAREHTLQRLRDTKHKLRRFKEWDYMAIPSKYECEKCKFVECASRYTEVEPPPQITSQVQEKESVPQTSTPQDDDAPW